MSRRRQFSITGFLVSALGLGVIFEVFIWVLENFASNNNAIMDIQMPILHYAIGIIFVLLVLRIWYVLWRRRGHIAKRGNSKSTRAKKQTSQPYSSQSLRCRSDEEILKSAFQSLNGAEFERLLALYFRDQGYTVQEVGVGGNDGGVDLVITDSRGEKTAVQAKCYSEHNLVPVQTVRELVGAKRNHNCILTLIVTTSDLTAPAKREAEQFKVEYWHGALMEHKLRAWGKWQPVSPPNSKQASKQQAQAKAVVNQAQAQVAASSDTKKCICGAIMTKRVSKTGNAFMGCSSFPKCRHTESL